MQQMLADNASLCKYICHPVSHSASLLTHNSLQILSGISQVGIKAAAVTATAAAHALTALESEYSFVCRVGIDHQAHRDLTLHCFILIETEADFP